MTTSRPSLLCIGGKELPLPVFFPSISSVKTALPPQDYLDVLSSLVGFNSQFLVSAYDLATIAEPESAVQVLQASREAGALILMDSGNYESFWKDAQSKWPQSAFHDMLEKFHCDLAFGFDEQHPPDDLSQHVSLVVSRWHEDQAAAGQALVVPIVHGAADTLPDLCAAVANGVDAPMIAVPERRLGDGVLERARTVLAIRQKLDQQETYTALHLLGTGNPISIALYTSMGADSFDGLEWCQTVVDHDSALLYHLSQADFFSAQTGWGDEELSYQARTLAHNLEFYSEWMQRLRAAVAEDEIVSFCRHHFPERVFRECSRAFKWGVA